MQSLRESIVFFDLEGVNQLRKRLSRLSERRSSRTGKPPLGARTPAQEPKHTVFDLSAGMELVRRQKSIDSNDSKPCDTIPPSKLGKMKEEPSIRRRLCEPRWSSVYHFPISA